MAMATLALAPEALSRRPAPRGGTRPSWRTRRRARAASLARRGGGWRVEGGRRRRGLELAQPPAGARAPEDEAPGVGGRTHDQIPRAAGRRRGVAPRAPPAPVGAILDPRDLHRRQPVELAGA